MLKIQFLWNIPSGPFSQSRSHMVPLTLHHSSPPPSLPGHSDYYLAQSKNLVLSVTRNSFGLMADLDCKTCKEIHDSTKCKWWCGHGYRTWWKKWLNLIPRPISSISILKKKTENQTALEWDWGQGKNIGDNSAPFSRSLPRSGPLWRAELSFSRRSDPHLASLPSSGRWHGWPLPSDPTDTELKDIHAYCNIHIQIILLLYACYIQTLNIAPSSLRVIVHLKTIQYTSPSLHQQTPTCACNMYSRLLHVYIYILELKTCSHPWITKDIITMLARYCSSLAS